MKNIPENDELQQIPSIKDIEAANDATVPNKKVKSFTVVTFNAGLMQYRFLGIRLFQNPPFTNTRLAHIPVALRTTNADIIALQEIFDQAHADYLTDSLRLLYPYSARRTSGTENLFTMHNGLLVLSKFPIQKTHFHPFKHNTWAESMFGSKGVLEVVIEVEGAGSVCLLNVHMASGTIDPESTALNNIRAEEMSEVLQIVSKAVDMGYCPIIVGDFNAAPTVCPASYRMLINLEWEDLFLSAMEYRMFNKSSSSLPEKLYRVDIVNDVSLTSRRPFEEPASQQQSNPRDIGVNSTFIPGESERFPANQDDTCHFNKRLQRRASDYSGTVETTRIIDDKQEDDVLHFDSNCRFWTWDPRNALNMIGPHSRCRGLRCDHVFFPPMHQRGAFKDFRAVKSQILFDQPRVLVYSKWLRNCLLAPIGRCCAGDVSGETTAPLLVSLSDHYAVKIVLEHQSSS